jgi:hypothetical protein
LLPVAASTSQLVIALHRAVVAGLLCTSEARELRRQVETLRREVEQLRRLRAGDRGEILRLNAELEALQEALTLE